MPTFDALIGSFVCEHNAVQNSSCRDRVLVSHKHLRLLARSNISPILPVSPTDRVFILAGAGVSAESGIPTCPWRGWTLADRKSTRLNSSHLGISYAVF